MPAYNCILPSLFITTSHKLLSFTMRCGILKNQNPVDVCYDIIVSSDSYAMKGAQSAPMRFNLDIYANLRHIIEGPLVVCLPAHRVTRSPFFPKVSKVRLRGFTYRFVSTFSGSIPVFHMSIFKVPSKVLHILESIRSHFFNGHDPGSKKACWVKWNNVLTDKKRGGLVIVAIHGVGGKILRNGLLLANHFKIRRQRVWSASFARIPRGGIEQNQFDSLVELVHSVTIVPLAHKWNWNLESIGIFSVASARRRIDEICLPNIGEETRWVKCVPIKINVLAWKIKTDALPTRFNISRRGIDIQDMSCPICDNAIESSDHLLFRCGLVRDIAKKVLSWWNLDHAN
ncbi:RNA-directed DNA polymerase, eukaryota [Tanacetum coccineum]